MRFLILACKAMLLAGCGDAAMTAPATALIPGPKLVAGPAEVFRLADGGTVIAPDDGPARQNARFFVDLVQSTTGIGLTLLDAGAETADVVFEIVAADSLAAAFAARGRAAPELLHEAYHLAVEPDGVRVRAADPAGLYYGMATLWQLLCTDEPGRIAAGGNEILDAPTLEWRGLMLDSARHMQSPEFIKRYIDWMSLHKLNVFHWHLTDDQAWRIEILKYRQLTDVGAWRVPAGAAPAKDIDPRTGEPRRYGGYYSQETIRDVVAHAALRHVTVVPEIDVPGHATAAIAAYPELGVDGVVVADVPASWGIYPNVFNLEESTFAFLEDVLAEVVELFPARYIHLGGDEVVLEQWQSSDRIRERMAEIGIADTQELQNYYVERLQEFLARHRRSVIGWDEIVESDLPAEAAVMSWRGIDGAIAAAARGHRTVLSPAPTVYLDHVQSNRPDEPPGRGGVIDVRHIYEADPVSGVPGEYREFVLGLQANVWTEHIRTEDRVAYMTWPRALAIAELSWAADGQRDWPAFRERLRAHAPRLGKLGIRSAPVDVPEALPAESKPGLLHREDREMQLCQESIVLALEDDAPLDGERESYMLDIMDPCWLLDVRGLPSLADLRVQAAVGQLPFNFEIGDMIGDVVVEPAATAAGELNVRLGDCDGPLLAALSLEPALASEAATLLPPAPLRLPPGVEEPFRLCLRFARHGIAPIWAIDWFEIRADGSGTGP